jgi:hypothetical protein
MIYYYLIFSPNEALIASQLEPKDFGMYMAQGSKKGSAEQLMYAEIEGGFGDFFDWEFAEKKCVHHSDGRPKNSLYLSIYRVLEHIPLHVFKMMYLVTKDGRTLSLEQEEYKTPENWKGYALYKELCPVHPLIVSSLYPDGLADYIINDEDKITVPAIIFTDICTIDFDDKEHSGNIGGMYDRDLDHLRECIAALKTGEGKLTKTVDRSFDSKFTYQIIENGIYVAREQSMIFFRMPSREILKQTAYDWARSANIF